MLARALYRFTSSGQTPLRCRLEHTRAIWHANRMA
jgi:hypothetical protein